MRKGTVEFAHNKMWMATVRLTPTGPTKFREFEILVDALKWIEHQIYEEGWEED